MISLPMNIKLNRISLDMTQDDLAQKIGVSQRAVSGYEMGTIKPTVEILTRLADVFGCSIDKLVRGKIGVTSRR